MSKLLLVASLALPLLSACAKEVPVASSLQPVKEELSGSRPNIIFIFSDDHGAQSIGAYGAKWGVDATPRLDRMAAEGMRFDDCMCGNSLCGPSRATVMTGKFPHANGYAANEGPDMTGPFNGHQPTLPKYLKKKGYETAMFGKWHLESEPIGFDAWEVLTGQGIYYNPIFLIPKTKQNPTGRVTIPGYVTDITTDLALNWLESRKDPKKPFLLMLHQKAPHRHWLPGPQEAMLWKGHKFPEPSTLFDDYAGRGPAAAKQKMEIGRDMHMAYDLHVGPSLADPTSCTMDPFSTGEGHPNEYVTPAQRKVLEEAFNDENRAFLANPPKGDALTRWKYQRYIMDYLRCAKGVDRNVGTVLDWLKAHGMEKNTIVVYSSDQGFYLGEHGWFDKRWIYEESIRMPFIIRWPGHIAPGTACDATIQNTDFMPTFLDLAGYTPAQMPKDIHGKSIVPLLEGKDVVIHDGAYYHYYEKREHNVPKQVGIRAPRYTLAWFYDEKPAYWELYDRAKDPQQLKNVYNDPAYAQTREELTAKLKELAVKYNDQTDPWGNKKPAPTGGDTH